MPWRLLIAILLCVAAAAAWGGLQLGNWLVANGPTQIELHNPMPSAEHDATLDANGRPFVASAPQPLEDGRLGVPASAPPVNWDVPDDSLLDEHRPIALATTPITMDEAIAIASGEQAGGVLQGIAQVHLNDHGVQPVDATGAPPPPPSDAARAAAPSTDWIAPFHAALKACESRGFFARPSCAWAARKRYCEPNRAWGQVEGCPRQGVGGY